MYKLSDLYHSKIILLLLFIAIIFIGFNLVKAINSKTKIDKEISDMDAKIQKLEEENQKMKEQTEAILNPEFIKKEAKRRLNLQEEGEKLIIIKP